MAQASKEQRETPFVRSSPVSVVSRWLFRVELVLLLCSSKRLVLILLLITPQVHPI